MRKSNEMTCVLICISICLLSYTLLFIGCSTTQPGKNETPAGEQVAKFPKMIVGDSWVERNWKGVWHIKVIKVFPDGSFILESRDLSSTKIYHLTHDNGYHLTKKINTRTGEEVFIPTPPAKDLQFPLFVGKKWYDRYTGISSTIGQQRRYWNRYKVRKVETVYTKAGSFKAYKIFKEIGGPWSKNETWRVSYWYSPKLKRVIKSDDNWMTGSELLSYQLSEVDKEVKKITDQKTTSAIKETSSEILKITRTRWAVVTGISQYKDTRIPSLRYAASDAKAFYDWLISPSGGRYPPARVKLLINADATMDNMKKVLYEWLGQVLEEDVVTIFFAGHGSPQSPDNPENLFLLPHDVQYDSVATTGFPMWDIETALKRFIKARRVIVITDACHSGGVGQSFDVARREGRGINIVPISSNLQNLSKIGDGICIISASDDSQFSQESKKWGGGHGVFTYYLLKGLSGDADYNKNRSVSLGEIIPYLSE